MKDRIVRAITGDGAVRCAAAVTTNLVEEARKIHNMAPTATAAVGRLLTATAIMGGWMKGDNDKLTLQIEGGGPIGRITAISDSNANVKCSVDNPLCDIPEKDGKLDVGGAVGTDGFLGIIQDLGLKEPYIGKIPICSGEIGDDIAMYYAKSEQIPSIVAVGVLVDTDLSVKAAGGLILQVMPEATDEQISSLEEMVKNMPQISTSLSKGATPEDLISYALDSFDSYTMTENETCYRCDCSMERIEKVIASLGKKEIQDIIDTQANAEVICHFCNNKYLITKDKLTEIKETL